MIRSSLLLSLALLGTLATTVAAQRDVQTLRIGQPVSAVLPSTGPTLEPHGVFQSFQFRGNEGVTYRVSVRSEAFDTFVKIGRTLNGVTTYLVEDDDGGDELNSIARFRAPATGDYLVIVQAVGEERGSYTLLVEEGRPGEENEGGSDDPVDDRLPSGSIPSVQIGQTLRESLEGPRFYSVRVSNGQQLLITARSDTFDTYLAIGRAADGRFAMLASDDDGGAGTNSRLAWPAPAGGDYIIRVSAYGEGTGDFVLRVADAATLGASRPAARPIRPGSEVRAALDDESGVTEDDYSYADWTLAATPGTRYRVTLRSVEFDPFLEVGRVQGGAFQKLWENDDIEEEDRNSRVHFTATEGGEYIVRARAYSAGEMGDYTLLVEELPPVRTTPVVRRITIGQTVTGTLAESDARLEDGSAYHHYIFTANQGERIEIALSSTEFDTFLTVGRMVDATFTEYASNDDAGDGTDSRLPIILPASGEHVIRVNTFGADQMGAYTLRITRGR